MKSIRVASRYSKALLELAIERNELEQVKDDALVVINAINGSRELKVFLTSPVIKPSQKEIILAEIFSKNVSELTSKFISLIVKQGRDAVLLYVFDAFINQYRDYKNIVEASFTTASPVAASTLEQIKQKLEQSLGKNVEITSAVDPTLIGGYIVDMKNYRLDASLAGGMKKLKRELSK